MSSCIISGGTRGYVEVLNEGQKISFEVGWIAVPASPAWLIAARSDHFTIDGALIAISRGGASD